MELYGFVLLQDRMIPELNTRARLFRHLKTGAELLSLENEDENKVFSLNFRTPPPDSTGLPHIMEHSVLCGSAKYPVKEPFVELLKGSLKTFVNAFTFPDKTCYPVASQNLQDFYNLIDVYVDAVFYPLIPEHILRQEGWHYELDTVESPLTYKGVVFNEMKGVYSNPDSLLERGVQHSLFPDHPYGLDSGGDPREMPHLTYAQFKAFHQKYYHPSNTRIFFYGDDDPQERLRRMDGYLSAFEAIQVDSHIPLQPRFAEPQRTVVHFDPGDDPANRKGMLVINWLLPETQEVETNLALHILNHILVGTPASPLRKALIDSGLGEDLAGGGLEWQLRQLYFSVGLKGMQVGADDALSQGEQLERLIWDTLECLATEGIDPGQVAASLNTVEFELRENNTGAFPRGLFLMLRALTTWLYDSDPLSLLAFEAPLDVLKQRLEAGEKVFEALIAQHFLANPHRTLVRLQPENGLSQREETAEAERLAQIRASFTPEQLAAIVEETKTLKKLQETPDLPEALATIPMLKLSDLDRQNKVIPLERSNLAGSELFYHDLFTNGILYLDLGFDLHLLPQELLPYTSLFGRALLELGTEKEDYVRLSQRIGQVTGGITPETYSSQVRLTRDATTWLFLRSKAVVSRTPELLAILADILLTPRLDNPERFRQLVLEEKAQQEAALVPMGHRVVNRRLRARFNEADWASEQISGISYLLFLRQLVEQVEQNWPAVLQKLEAIRQVLINRPGMIVNLTLDQAGWGQARPELQSFLERLPDHPVRRSIWKPAFPAPDEGLTIPAQVNYVGKGANLFELGYQPSGSVEVITNFLRTTWLWERVRVQGGAYGGFCVFDQRSGVLTYLSYRDPNLLSTLENYDQAAGYLTSLDAGRLSQDELTKNIIGAIGALDAYLLPDAKGFASTLRHLAGDTDESRQQWREQVLDTTLEDFHQFGEVLEKMQAAGRVVVLGSQEAIQAANAQKESWLAVQKVL